MNCTEPVVMISKSNMHRNAQFFAGFFRAWGRTAYLGRGFYRRKVVGEGLINRGEIRIDAVASINICGEDSKSGRRPGFPTQR